MVNIVKGILNKVGFSLSELSICDEPMEYRFDFKSENSEGIEASITMTPINASNRLQVFEFTEGTDISFPLDGYYSYSVYQTTSDNLVEVGLIRVSSGIETSSGSVNALNPQVYGS